MTGERALWRAMRRSDLDRVEAIAAKVHPNFPEDRDVLADRLRLWPSGCRILEKDGSAAGYLFSHPWSYGGPPALNTRIAALPAAPDTYYLHDLALLPEERGKGFGQALVAALAGAVVPTFPTLSLVAVNGSAPFWRSCGFAAFDDPALAGKLASYGPDARFMARRLG